MQHGQKGKSDPYSEETQARSVFLFPTLVFRLKTRTAVVLLTLLHKQTARLKNSYRSIRSK